MLRFGILTAEQYARASMSRWFAGSAVSLNLLELSDCPNREEILRFEKITFNLCTSNGTTRRTFRHRMADVDELTIRLLQQVHGPEDELRVQDRAASNCLTSTEWAKRILPSFPRTHLEASDRLLYLFRVNLPRGRTYFVEPGGEPLQYVTAPFVIALCPREPYRYPFNHFIAAAAMKSFRRLRLAEKLELGLKNTGYRIDKISCVHPEAHSLTRLDSRFSLCERSVFDRTPDLNVLRTMNILNLVYFSREQILDGIRAAYQSLRLGGLWIVGRTVEKDNSNHVTFFRKTLGSWSVVERIGNGSEIESLVTSDTALAEESAVMSKDAPLNIQASV